MTLQKLLLFEMSLDDQILEMQLKIRTRGRLNEVCVYIYI